LKANGGLATLPRKGPGAKVRDYDAHVLVCGGSDCKKRGSKDIRKALKSELRGRGMVGDVRVDSVDCLGLCKHGPNAVVYPGGVWYLGLREENVPEVVERHLGGGEPVEGLVARFRPRKGKK
jgi:(2Fe-2S) ferredoxin